MASFEDRVFVALAGLRQAEPVTLQLSAWEAWIVLSQLQLALRHPRNLGEPALVGMAVAQRLQSLVAPESPLAELVEMGWNPANDVEG